MVNIRNSTLRYEIVVALSLFVAVPLSYAQKKAGGAGSSQGGASSAGGSQGTASPSSSNAPFEIEMLSYAALDEIMDKLAEYSCNVPSSGGTKFGKILVLDTPTLQALQAFDAFYANAEALKSAFNSMRGVAGAGAGGIDMFADVTNAVAAAATASTSETSSSFTIQDPTAAAVFLRHLQRRLEAKRSCPSAYYAGVYSVDISGATIKGKRLNNIDEELGTLAVARSLTLNAIMTRPASDMTGNPPAMPCVATPTLVAGSNPAKYAISSQDPCVTVYNNLDGTYNSYLAGLSAPNAAGQPGLSTILQGYRLRGLFGTATAKAPMLGVYLNVAAAGGTQQDRKNLLTALFTGDWIRYSGGVSVNLIVFEIAGDDSKILFSDLVRYRTPLGMIKKPQVHSPTQNAGDNLMTFPAH